LADDEQIESHAESYIYPKSVPLRYNPPWHTTRADYTTYPWHLLCNAIDSQFEFPTFRMLNEQSVDDALSMSCKRFLLRMLCKSTKNKRE